MKAYILVEGPQDAEVFKRLLAQQLQQGVEFVAGNGISRPASLARSLLVRRRKPLAIVVDSKSVDPRIVRERRESTEELVKSVAAHVPVKVIVAVPEIEAVFFHDPGVLERFFGRKLPGELLSLGRRDPVGVLRELSGQSNAQWDTVKSLDALDAPDVEVMRAAPVVKELTAFLEQIQHASKAGA